MRKQLGALVLVLGVVVSTVTPARAARQVPAVRHAVATVLFRLSVDGPVASTDTFWVAFGPLAGTWGIIQLHAASPKLYVARATLPRGRTVFSFIEGAGTMRTRLGLVPGNPVITIEQFGPTRVSGSVFPLVVWHEPIG